MVEASYQFPLLLLIWVSLSYYLDLKSTLKIVYIDAPKINPINEPMATKNINIGRSISTFGLDCQDSTVQANHIEPRDPHRIRIQFCLVIVGLYLEPELGIAI